MAAKADWYTPRVGARTELAQALEAKGEPWLRARQLKLADVQKIVRSGTAARQADREQQEQLAEQAAGRKGRSVDAAEVTEREDMLAATLPAVIDDLMEAGLVELARFLARLSFARYRVRVLSTPVDPAAPPDAAVDEEVKKVERVEKSDLATRADGLAALCAALRKPGREPIVAELTERGIDSAALEQLEADATAVALQGRNTPRPVEATAREREAVLQQRRKWSAIRKLVQRAVEGDAELERLYRPC
jgi:hypothetical protein